MEGMAETHIDDMDVTTDEVFPLQRPPVLSSAPQLFTEPVLQNTDPLVDGSPGQYLGSLHPDKSMSIVCVDMRVVWSDAEKYYVRNWMKTNINVPVRGLYETIQVCQDARHIFHSNHSSLDKVSYIYKLIKKE